MANGDGLERMERLLEALGDPEKDLRVIHVAGTNGKGSTCVMIASILEEAGYSVGLYTSPHLETECERIQIWSSGERLMIEQSDMDALLGKVAEVSDEMGLEKQYGPLRVFERYTAAAYMYYADKRPDYVVLECGMGGRHDSTNTIEDPLACVITQVGLDHTDELGSTIEEVAYNKAGIIKKGIPVVSQSDNEAVKNVVRKVASEQGSEFIDVNLSLSEYGYLHPTMEGEYQMRNAVTAALAVKTAGADVSDEILKQGISRAVLPGRFEILSGDISGPDMAGPVFIVDGAHNPDAMRALVSEYNKFSKTHGLSKTVMIFGCMQDKNSSEMVDIITSGMQSCEFITVAIDYGRAEDADVLADKIAQEGLTAKACSSTEEAFEMAMDSGADSVLVAGSIYLAGELRSIYKNAQVHS